MSRKFMVPAVGGTVVTLSLFWTPATAALADDAALASCEKVNSTTEFTECVAAIETKLNESYKAYLRRFDVKLPYPEIEHMPEKRKAVIEAERAWVRYRAAECAIYDIAEGNITNNLKMDCMARTAAERIRELEMLGKVVP